MEAQKHLEVKPPPGTNQVIIAHSFPKGTAIGEMTSMGTVIIKPKGVGNGYEIVKQLTLADLATLGTLQ
ncbi:Histidine phosphatase family protein OS=Lysinibacillus sphaericus OX=1421 GN=LS41612_14975 PE=4 SV=1 [Lysinibacillus sphaericus]